MKVPILLPNIFNYPFTYQSDMNLKIGDNLIPRKNPRGQTYIWIGATRVGDLEDKSTDVSIIDNGYISITPLNIDQTHYKTLNKLSMDLK